MPYVEKSIEINAPVETVFQSIVQSPERMVDWWTPLELQERITPAPTTVGSVSKYVYNMVGIRIKGEHRVMDVSDNRHLIVKTTSGIDATFDFSFSPTHNRQRTMLTIRVNYGLPGAILGQLFNRLTLEKRNSDDLDEGLQKLKTMLETVPV